jgi:hypothetical protein
MRAAHSLVAVLGSLAFVTEPTFAPNSRTTRPA